MEGCITTDTTAQEVRLTTTAPYFCNHPSPAVSGAIVTLNDGTNTVTLKEDSLKKGVYKTLPNYYGVAGRLYTLTIGGIDVDGDSHYETYLAASYMNAAPPLEKIQVKKKIIFYENVWTVNVWMQDPEAVSNYYLPKIYKNQVYVSDTITEWHVSRDELFNGCYLQDRAIAYIVPANKEEKIYPNDTILLELCAITQDYYSFIKEMQAEYRGSNPLFGGHPSNIRSNVRLLSPSGSASVPHGYFAAYSISRAQTVYKE